VALALTLRASKTDFSLPRPTLQAIRPVTSKARERSRRKPQSAAFFARGLGGRDVLRPRGEVAATDAVG
jgi:hypothetical protein